MTTVFHRQFFVMTIILLGSIDFYGQSAFGQSKDISIPLNKNGDTVVWYKDYQSRIDKRGLPILTEMQDSLHFRFLKDIQAIDIWTNDYLTFYGALNNFTTSYNPDSWEDKKQKPEKIFTSNNSIDTATARQIYKLFIDLNVFSIPNMDSIRDWEHGFDGLSIYFECSTPLKYSFKYYWTPSAFKDRIKEAGQIDSLVNSLETILQMEKSFLDFIGTLPYGSYHAGGITVVQTFKTKKKRKDK